MILFENQKLLGMISRVSIAPSWSARVEPTRFGSELITGIETDGKTVSRWKQARLMLHDGQLFGGVYEPKHKLLQASRRCRPGGDVKRS